MNKIIHLSSDADFDKYVYTQVYSGGSGTHTVIVNGTSVNMTSQSTLDIILHSISAVADVYVLGLKKIGDAPSVING